MNVELNATLSSLNTLRDAVTNSKVGKGFSKGTLKMLQEKGVDADTVRLTNRQLKSGKNPNKIIQRITDKMNALKADQGIQQSYRETVAKNSNKFTFKGAFKKGWKATTGFFEKAWNATKNAAKKHPVIAGIIGAAAIALGLIAIFSGGSDDAE